MDLAALPDLGPASSEIFLALASMALLMIGVFSPAKSAFRTVQTLALGVLVSTAIILVTGFEGARAVTFGGLFVIDSFAVVMKLLVLVGSFSALAVAAPYLRENEIDRFEYPVLLVLATLGMFIMLSSNNLITLYVGLELQSLALYVLAAINRDRNRSTEAGLKYFVLGALSSGMLLYGISLIYGFSGTMDFDVLASTLKGDQTSLGMIVGMSFLVAGLAFKVSAVPFHMWTPDVYEGAPTPVTTFFAAAPKVAALGLFVRTMMGAFGELVHDWQQIIIFISVASMLLGALVAIVQTNIKRLLAYSSIGHMGYALVGLATGTQQGVEAIVLYIAIYLTMTLGSFAAVLAMRRSSGMVETIDDLAGLAKTDKPFAIALATLMFSLAGIPPLFGFFGKYYVFLAAWDAGLGMLALIGLVTSVISCFYYLRVVKVMFFDEPDGGFEPVSGLGVRAVIGISALINSPLSYFFLIAPLLGMASWAALSFQ